MSNSNLSILELVFNGLCTLLFGELTVLLPKLHQSPLLSLPTTKMINFFFFTDFYCLLFLLIFYIEWFVQYFGVISLILLNSYIIYSSSYVV